MPLYMDIHSLDGAVTFEDVDTAHQADLKTQGGYDVSYLHAEDVAARATLRRFAFPLAVFRHVRSEARAGRPYDIVNVQEDFNYHAALYRADAAYLRARG